jgi:hypothetical protein
MTAPADRDPMALPSCPRCGDNDRVVNLEPPELRGRNHADAPSSWPFECCRCVLVFTGTDAEWSRMMHDRTRYREAQAPRAMPSEVRP